ncbi:flagellar biosynthetic protein FliP [candidate division KSB1 bacterium]|nr:MAG: flagellar biosynthetic protein FliP [candidate division KSB1 bacterium]
MKRIFCVKSVLFLLLLIVLLSGSVKAQVPTIPKVTIGIERAEKPGDVAITLQILFLMTILSLAPALLILLTSFTRIIIIFHFIRQALGTQQMPSNQILIGLALFLTFFIMGPVWKEVNSKAIQPYLQEKITSKEAFNEAVKPVRHFMLKLTREKDLALFVKFANLNKPQNPDEIPTRVLIPAFVISELRIAFQIGFILYVPFLMIDMIVASVLMSMGMLMLPPIMISLPFKILLFVLVDGWYLIIDSVVTSFR